MHKISVQRVSFFGAVLILLFLFPSQTLAQNTVDLAVQYVEGTPKTDAVAYDVKVFLSVIDSAGNPIRDLKAENFTVAEDSQKVAIDSVDLVKNEPISIVLLIDTSGSMAGPGIENARKAATSFVSGLDANDLVSVLTFDNTVKTVIDFSKDHKAVTDDIALINSTEGAGTCLYDAAYQAVKMTATVPAGRRAVVLLTDGVDEKLGGGACSTHTEDNLVELATSGNTRVPIFTLGMGGKVNQAGLNRIGSDTGGRYLYSTNPNQLDALFLRLSEQLRSQYVLHYTSLAGSGAHGLAISVDYLSAKDTDTRNFLLPAMPTHMSFTSPTDGQEVSGKAQFAVSLSGGQTVQSVVFQINGQVIGSVNTTPYQLGIDFGSYPAGNLTVKAIAYGAGNVELANTSITVKVAASIPATPAPSSNQPSLRTLTIGGGVLALLLIVAGVVVFTVVQRRREEHRRDQEWNRAQNPVEPASPAEDRTMDSWEPSPDALGSLLVEASDDPTMIGHRFDITGSMTKLGRSADNDFPFPKDSPVSRHHAEIREKNGGLFLSEVESPDSSGQVKRPTYSTFVNDRKVGEESILLQTGDVIQLGKRVRLRYQAGRTASQERTYDSLMPDDDPEKTREE